MATAATPQCRCSTAPVLQGGHQDERALLIEHPLRDPPDNQLTANHPELQTIELRLDLVAQPHKLGKTEDIAFNVVRRNVPELSHRPLAALLCTKRLTKVVAGFAEPERFI